jgi:hypothetical protein
MTSMSMKKIAAGILLIWLFFACHIFAEALGIVFNEQENAAKTCESAIFAIQQGIRTNDDATTVLSQSSHITLTQNFLSPVADEVLPSDNNRDRLPYNSENPFQILRL